ncbi:coiled-coil domain-containing protein R3HCC1L-like [Uloborus diversus]|uniref:coiled-coil domain-containing protein R3HCC1L-like n=1 Tax=Uloborus diversus TaxID=327109 RepID=UPI00240A1A71|nr:coiled-coil domain-containing protein R3HCC1L-like [Uloborus diversus]
MKEEEQEVTIDTSVNFSQLTYPITHDNAMSSVDRTENNQVSLKKVKHKISSESHSETDCERITFSSKENENLTGGVSAKVKSVLKSQQASENNFELKTQQNEHSDINQNAKSSESKTNTKSKENENIVELFGFPVEFTTPDLISALSLFQKENYTIKWVDDCHALAVFTSPSLANQALIMHHPFVKIRALSEATKESKAKAKQCAKLHESSKPRPMTTATLARRLVSGALGIKNHVSKEQRDVEQKLLSEAREKKKLKAKQKQDMWDGVVSKN